MSVHNYTAGARTRNVVNIADPGGTTAAYTLTDNQAAPSAATDGFKNFHSQKTLHVLVKSTADQTMTITVHVYNSSLGSIWAPLQIPVRANAANTFVPMTVTHQLSAGDSTNQFLRFSVPIEGAERIAIEAAKGDTISSGNVQVFLGVNSI